VSNPYYQRTHLFPRHTTARGEAVQEELDKIEEAFDKIPDVTNFYSGSITYGVDTGAANAHVVNIKFGAESPEAGVHVAFVAAGTNTGQATLKYGTWNEKQIKRVDGSELLAGDIRQDQLLELRYTGSYWVITDVSTTGVFEAAADAQTSKNAASESADLAQAWATNPKDQEVVPGDGEFSSQHHAIKSAASAQRADQWANKAVDTEVEPGKFSAKHWATKAEASANDAANEIVNYLDALLELAHRTDLLEAATQIKKIHFFSTGTDYTRSSETEGNLSDGFSFYPVSDTSRFLIIGLATMYSRHTTGGNDARADLRMMYHSSADGAWKNMYGSFYAGLANTQPYGSSSTLIHWDTAVGMADLGREVLSYGNPANRAHIRLRGECGYPNNYLCIYHSQFCVLEYEQ